MGSSAFEGPLKSAGDPAVGAERRAGTSQIIWLYPSDFLPTQLDQLSPHGLWSSSILLVLVFLFAYSTLSACPLSLSLFIEILDAESFTTVQQFLREFKLC